MNYLLVGSEVYNLQSRRDSILKELGLENEQPDVFFGAIDAEEVAQVYVSRPESHIERPLKELKGFQRIALKAAERKTVTIPVRKSDLCHWDESAQAWMYEPDKPVFYVGGSPDKLSLAPMQ